MIKTGGIIEDIHSFNINVEDFVIYLAPTPKQYDDDSEEFSEPGVEYQMSLQFIKNLHFLTQKDSKRPILIHMKTCGGDCTEGMAIYDSICACPNPITILSHTHARSMSSIILQAADNRVLMPNSYFLFHEGYLGDGGTYKGVVSRMDYSAITREVMVDLYVEVLKTRGTKYNKWSHKRIREEIIGLMDKKEDVFLTAREAVEWGFADMVFGADGVFDWEALR